jgi:hypothetical protein
LLPKAATVVSLCVFCRELSSSAKQFTCTLPVVLGSAAHTVPCRDGLEGAVKLPFRSLTTRSPVASIRGLLAQSGLLLALPAWAVTLKNASAAAATGRIALRLLICLANNISNFDFMFFPFCCCYRFVNDCEQEVWFAGSINICICKSQASKSWWVGDESLSAS